MRTTELTIRDIHRSSEVDRWQIVGTDQRQSVAEHSYLVAMIALRYAKLMDMAPEFESRITYYALVHDLPEVLTGDLVAPVKELVDTSQLEQWERSLKVFGQEVNEHEEVKKIVKVADLTEAVVWLELHGTNDHARRVKARLKSKLDDIAAPFSDYVLGEILEGPQSFIDDLVEE